MQPIMRRILSASIFTIFAIYAAAQSGVGGGGQTNVSGGGSSGGSPTAGAQGFSGVINGAASAYNLQSGFQAFGCTITNGSPNVACTDVTFTTAMIGWLFHATNGGGCCLNQVGSVYLFGLNGGAENTIIGCSPSCPSGTAIVSTNATASATPTPPNSAIVTFGPDMTTTLTAMTTAGNAGVNCLPILLPGGIFLSKQPQFNYSTCQLPIQGPGDRQDIIWGYGAFSSMIAPTQDFNFAACTFGASGKGCFASAQGTRLREWGESIDRNTAC